MAQIPPSGGGPDWVLIGGSITAVLTVAGGIIAGLRGAFTGRSDEAYQRRLTRDNAATANASLTLESVFRLVNELQEEVGRKSAEITRIEGVCKETRSMLLVSIGELETTIRDLKATQHTLEQKIRELRDQLRKEF